MSDRRANVAVFGASDPRPGSASYELARRVGAVLAEQGRTVVNGGYGGVMEAASRGARDAGGRSIGVTCNIWQRKANAFLDEIAPTDSLPARVAKLLELAGGGFVVMPGATGTLSELAQVWELKRLGELNERPLVCVGDFWTPLVEMMARARAATRNCVGVVDDAEGLRTHFPRQGH